MKNLPLCLFLLIASMTFALPAVAEDTTIKDTADKAASAVGDAIESAGDFINDAAITTSITARFVTQKGLDPTSIGVSTNDGIVTLSGEVDHEAQSSLAELVTSQVKGVRKIRNNIVVKKR